MDVVDAACFDQVRTVKFDQRTALHKKNHVHDRTPDGEINWEGSYDAVDYISGGQVGKDVREIEWRSLYIGKVRLENQYWS